MPDTQPFRCFDRRFFAHIALATPVAVGLALWARVLERGSVGRLLVVALESVVIGFIIIATVRTIRLLDEMNQRIHLHAILVSFTATAVLGSALSLLERAGLRVDGWERLLWLFMAAVWGLGVLVIQRRYA